jgi:DNA-binding response OmpR family regulator
VLVVDDEPLVCVAVLRILTHAGLRAEAVDTGAKALAHPSSDAARLILLDVMLPDQSGLDVLRQLRARRPDLPAVLMTGYTVAPELAATDSLPLVRLLPKPFDGDELMAAVRPLLGPATKEVDS